jgi:hypothetical protein
MGHGPGRSHAPRGQHSSATLSDPARPGETVTRARRVRVRRSASVSAAAQNTGIEGKDPNRLAAPRAHRARRTVGVKGRRDDAGVPIEPARDGTRDGVPGVAAQAERDPPAPPERPGLTGWLEGTGVPYSTRG